MKIKKPVPSLSRDFKLKIDKYIPSEVEKRWQDTWERHKIYSPNLDSAKKPFYNLMMFPYPSAEGMHVGNMYAFTGADVFGRFMRMNGYDVFEPIGLDGFGIHSENYAIKIGIHPKEQAKVSEENFYRQLREAGNGFDWSRKVETYDPEYYKWTQWLFVQLFKAGLAYSKKAPVNFCPSCKTVLADEQVVNKIKNQKSEISVDQRSDHSSSGKREDTGEITVNVCERCGTEVYKKELKQWFFRITKYANRLLANLAKLDWTEKVKIAQRNWIGKSEGAIISFVILNSVQDLVSSRQKMPKRVRHDINKIDVFTTRPDTLYGATFLVLSPEHPIVAKLLKIKNQKSRQRRGSPNAAKIKNIEEYIQKAKKKTEQERLAEGKGKTGVFSGLYAVNPVNKEKIPIWIAGYVLMGYGTGAIMAVPAHDQRDFEFAKKYDLPIRQVIVPTKKSAFADGLVSQTGSLKDGLLKLKGDITHYKTFVKGKSSEPARPTPDLAYTDYGVLVNSGKYNGLFSEKAIKKIIKDLGSRGIAKKEITYHLRDWLISRQRYWGPPIPMVFCGSCFNKGKSWFTSEEIKKMKGMGISNIKYQISNKEIGDSAHEMRGWFPVPEKNLPVLLPDVKNWKPTGTGKSPLANVKNFVNTKCPNCKGPAKRETDVSDNFLDSSWYFLRYLATDMIYLPFPISSSVILNSFQDLVSSGSKMLKQVQHDIGKRERWLPVNMYIGGAEHSVLHLLYSRFVWKALCDLGLIDFSGGARPGSAWEEPFSRFYAHGLIIKEGAKMSKSKGNVVVPDDYITKFGADTLRCYLMFLGPFNQGGDFYDTGIEGMHRFVRRVWTLLTKYQISNIKYQISNERTRIMHKAIKKVTEDIGNLKYNTAIANLMEWHNYLKSKINPRFNRGQISKIEAENFLKLLAPFAPHVAEELYQRFMIYDLRFKNKKEKNHKSYLVNHKSFQSIHTDPWPKYDPKYLEEEEVTIVVQIDGKVRDTIKNQKSKIKNQKYVEEIANKSDRVIKHLQGKEIKKIVYVEGKVINFVTN